MEIESNRVLSVLVRLSHIDSPSLYPQIIELFVEMARFMTKTDILGQLKNVVDKCIYSVVEQKLGGPIVERKPSIRMLPNIQSSTYEEGLTRS